jgi:hypothetical protein
MMTPAEHREAMYGLCIAHISSPAENRMRSRTAKEQLAQAMADATVTRLNPCLMPTTSRHNATGC